MAPFPGASPPPGPIPIYLAAVNERMAEVAGRLADGVSGHPMTSPRYVAEVLRPAVERGAQAAGRDPSCPDPLPGPARDALGLPEGATYGDAARVVTRGVLEGTLPAEEPEELDAGEDVDLFLAGLGPQDDSYDPGQPLANLGWPVVVRGLLYRIDDEVLVGMHGQPDLAWDEFDPSEARSAHPEVVAAHTPRPRA